VSDDKPKTTLLDMAKHVYKVGFEAAEQGKYDDATKYLENLNSIVPVLTASALQTGRCHWEMHRWEAARKWFDLAVRLEPNNDDAGWTVGLLALQMGDFLNGWQGYERRWGSKTFKAPKIKTKHPQWERYSSKKKPLIWCEQGVGDQLLYASLIEAVAKECEHVTVMIDLRLANLLQRGCKAKNVTFIGHNARVKMSEHDSHIPIASLGRHFIRSIRDIEPNRSVGYIKADPNRVEHWRNELKLDGQRVIGLSWASTAPAIGKHKSVGLEALRPLFDIPNTKFINLQYGEEQHKQGENFHPNLITTHIDTFMDLESVAALMTLCDVIVSPSGANVHLAGAMGKTVMLLDANKLWYWNNRAGYRSLWYPGVKIFQRENMNAPWDMQVQQVKDELEIRYNMRAREPEHFAFFHMGQDISAPQKMVKSILRHNPDAYITMFTDTSTPDVMGITERIEADYNRDEIIYSRVKSYAQKTFDHPVMYLDTDMIVQGKINAEAELGSRDIALCERVFACEAMFNIEQRGIRFDEHTGKTIGQVYPYVACAVIGDGPVWKELLDIYDTLDSKYRKWYGDQEAMRIYGERHPYRIRNMPESVYGCLPEAAHEGAKILHYKGEARKKLFEEV